MNDFKFGETSITRLKTCHPDLQRVMFLALSRSSEDFTILQGIRSEQEQNKLWHENKTKVKYPDSKHNSNPSLAVDIAPYPIDWHNTKRFYDLAKVVLSCADDLGIQLRWGGDWDMDGDHTDQTFNDLPHFELSWRK